MQRPPLPPFNDETALAKVNAAEDAWNSRDPAKVAQAYTPESIWRNRDEFFQGREAINDFLIRKWTKELWAYTDNRISVRFEYEWQQAKTGQWFRTHGNEHSAFNADSHVSRHDMSASDIPITARSMRKTRSQ